MEYRYRVAFIINGKQFNTWFISPIEYSEDPVVKNQFRSKAKDAALAYIAEARKVPKTGVSEAFAIWPEVLPVNGVIQPLDAFEITQ